MRKNKLNLYVHVVWATWDRQPLIYAEFERKLMRYIEAVAIDMRCTVLAINCMPDHVHVVLKFPSTVTISELVKRMKGASSHFANEELVQPSSFKWQGSYGAYTICKKDLPRIIAYVEGQKHHHAADKLWAELEMAEERPPAD